MKTITVSAQKDFLERLALVAPMKAHAKFIPQTGSVESNESDEESDGTEVPQ